MTLYWLDQSISWVTVFLGWWIIHQTGGVKFSLPSFLMRLGVGGFALSLAIVTLLRANFVPVPFAGVMFKTFLATMFIGIILLHQKRFQKI